MNIQKYQQLQHYINTQQFKENLSQTEQKTRKRDNIIQHALKSQQQNIFTKKQSWKEPERDTIGHQYTQTSFNMFKIVMLVSKEEEQDPVNH
ncbi:hypothetical protein G9A89_006358 [Geosiphon pyriformis]|nr:hypothetical protein G9A89_006358 [Geosiphon pyriformis]